jgi:probable F420-dependent oxidoreductase
MMEFGVGSFPTHDGVGPGALARLVEERGQESLFFSEHTHIPASRITPYPGGGELPRKYWHSYDLFVALATAAQATTRLRLGSGICLVVARDPIITASETASIDHLSGGRLEFGVGAGWNREELSNHGIDPRRRMAIMREKVEAIREIWTEDSASYAGEHVHFDRIWSHPKPVQRPSPPILIGGNGPGVVDRVLDFGDAWFPNYVGIDRLYDRIRELLDRAERPVGVHLAGLPAEPRDIERAERAGITRVVHWLPSAGLSQIERALEVWESAIAEAHGE